MTSVSKWIPLLLVLLEVKLCCNFLPLGQKRGECWVWLVSSEESGLNAVYILFFLVSNFFYCLFSFKFFFGTQVGKTANPASYKKKKKRKQKQKKKYPQCPPETLLHFPAGENS